MTEYAGRLSITWPAPSVAIPGHSLRLHDTDTGEWITCVTDMTIRADAQSGGIVTAELTMLADADGEYLRHGERIKLGEHGELPTITQLWVVAEMYVEQEKPHTQLPAVTGKYGTATCIRADDGTVTVVQADDTIGVTVDLLSHLGVGHVVDGLFVLDTAGEYRYRPTALAHNGHVVVFTREAGTE